MKTLYYFLLSVVMFFFYWGLFPKFDDIRACFFTTGLMFLGLAVVEMLPKNEKPS
jgi:hypothetical protein